ncbi:hypothetical protein PSHT_15559, partial [Puccinia striiformis]
MRSGPAIACLIIIASEVIAPRSFNPSEVRTIDTLSTHGKSNSGILLYEQIKESSQLVNAQRYPLISLSKRTRSAQTAQDSKTHLFEKLIMDSPLLSSLNPHKRLEMIFNWQKNQDKVISIYEDSRQLNEIQLQLQKKFDWIRSNPFHDAEQLSISLGIFEKSKTKISLFKQWKLSQLGQLDLYSNLKIIDSMFETHQEDKVVQKWIQEHLNEMSNFDANQMWQDFGSSFMNEITNLVSGDGQQFESLKLVDVDSDFPASNYILKTMSFLYKNEFIDLPFVRRKFQEDLILKTAVHYVISSLKSEGEDEDSMWKYYESITSHPRFPLLNDIFQVLSEMEIRNINLSFLSEKIKFFGQKLNQASLSVSIDWEKDFNYFTGLAKTFEVEEGDNPRGQIFYNGSSRYSLAPTSNSPKELKYDVARLYQLLIKISSPRTTYSQSWEKVKLFHSIVQYLHFIEIHYFYDIRFIVPRNTMRGFGNNLPETKILVLAFSRSLESFSVLASYLHFFSNHMDEDLYASHPEYIKSILEHYHNTSIEDYEDFQAAYGGFYKGVEKSDMLKYQDNEIDNHFGQGGEALKTSIDSFKLSIMARIHKYTTNQKVEKRKP